MTIRGSGGAWDGPTRAGRKRPTAPVAPELETDAAAQRRQERQRQRGATCAAPRVREQQALARAKTTEEHAHLRLRHRQSADERRRSLHTNGSAAQVTDRPEPHPQTARGAPSAAAAVRSALERQRPQSAKPAGQRGGTLAPSASARALVAGSRVRVQHWETWLCHATPPPMTTTTTLTASQSSPLLRGGQTGRRAAEPPEEDGAGRAGNKTTSIVVDMRRLRVLGDADERCDEDRRMAEQEVRHAW